MSTEITDYDTSEYLENEQDIIAYLNAIAEYDDPALMQAALGNVAKARGMTQIAKDAGVGRESLYKSLSKDGNPSFQTIANVIHALGRTPHHPSRLKKQNTDRSRVNPPRGILRIRISVKASGTYISGALLISSVSHGLRVLRRQRPKRRCQSARHGLRTVED